MRGLKLISYEKARKRKYTNATRLANRVKQTLRNSKRFLRLVLLANKKKAAQEVKNKLYLEKLIREGLRS